MTIRIDRARSSTPELEAFIVAHLQDMEPTAPEASRHAQGTARLLAPDARLLLAFDDDALVGTGALVPVEPGHEELKSMRTAPSHRGRGIGAAMLGALLDDARSRGVGRVSLETGAADFFWPAHRLYAKAGFEECEPFGAYVDDPHSLFLSLRLS
ncbi:MULTISPECIES: GNAT family N-acetyltransferase [Bacteria]|uniref:GNAT family N-acetyltransferase n=1 Tax=Bacteria TaxID=2 RepID=UPI003C7D1825